MTFDILAKKTHLLNERIEKIESKRNFVKQFCSMQKYRKAGLISVVILTWNRTEWISDVVESFTKFHNEIEPDIEIEWIYIDNGSTNKEVKNISSQYKWDRVIRNSKNLGVSAGVTQAFEASNGEFILILEDDWKTLATKPFLKKSIDILDNFTDIGLVQFKNNFHLYLDKVDESSGHVTFSPNIELMKSDSEPLRGKHKRRTWYDIRTTVDASFFTLTGESSTVYSSGCSLVRGNVFDLLGALVKDEHIYGERYAEIYNTALLLSGERLFKHLGAERAKGYWHE